MRIRRAGAAFGLDDPAPGASLREVADALGVSYQRVHQIVDVSTGKGALKPGRVHERCSFCGLDASRAGRIIAGPGMFICDRCVDLAAETVSGGGPSADEDACLVPVDVADSRARCGFCGKRRDRTRAMAEAPARPRAGKLRGRRPGVRICDECVELCREIQAEQRHEV